MLDLMGPKTVEFEGVTYDCSHGSWFDRGSADSYYHRAPCPHRGGVGGASGPRLEPSHPDEVEAYMAGYRQNEQAGNKKDWV
jgi:hypothetical protein